MRTGALLILATTLLAAGCGGGKSGTNGAGAKIFASAGCGGCHTLSAAKSSGQSGPNLDQLKPSYDAVVRVVSDGGGGMPAYAGRLSTGQIRALAAFVVASTKNISVGVPRSKVASIAATAARGPELVSARSSRSPG